ncbi:MAG: transglycosylase SLT domain-containing protein, partial [Jaaginema sp. PMC 1079.18]|nr:transglycosylase SLT domain-containing protein [Jaaginema sp. PMC 1079.18]
VLNWAELPPEARRDRLQEVVEGARSYDRNRARYLLANDSIADFEGGNAIVLLEELESEYPVLAPQILLKRARAYELTNEITRSREVLEQLATDYPDSPAAATALYQLGQEKPEYLDQALTNYPELPVAHQIAFDRLDADPNQPELWLYLLRNAPNHERIGDVRDRLQEYHETELTPEDWGAIADTYWQEGEYSKAVSLYEKAPNNPQNLYRIARGQQIAGNKNEAIAAYRTLNSAFPEAAENAQGLLHLATLSNPKDALIRLGIVRDRFPEQAPEALSRQAKIYDQQGQGKAAAQARQALLETYSDSDETSQYRWQTAQRLAQQGNFAQAWKWAYPIAMQNPDSSLAPKAAFWVGKWAKQLNRPEDAKAAFEYVLSNYPESYYAWRSAVLLGWDVGDFSTVRQMRPEVAVPERRSPPPAGSEAFQELYQLGQDADALELWQAETASKAELSVNEQFTTALLKLTQQEYIEGIGEIWELTQRESQEEQENWQQLRDTPEYWHALFPFPYKDIILNWANQRELNPLLVASLIRQESRFEKEIRSPVGAVGLMQVMPATGEEIAEANDITDYSLTNPEDNVRLGTWYLDFTHREYNNNSLLAIASYNAGPSNAAKWVREFGLNDPDTFVEQIPFPETKGYVESVFGNYWNYLRLYNPEIEQQLKGVG